VQAHAVTTTAGFNLRSVSPAQELFSVLGPVRRARLIGPGKAEVVYIRRDDAIRAYQKYNNRDLDGMYVRAFLFELC